ncbi:exopolysaccharide biosynthesis protein [Labrenzia sp. 011]|uniref:exopolysaccharide biosynthesis protein n=1 Tax=Labrenzia sp. 011 TaxID=2171494 RepID=UPI0014024034|nr:exopolysaccharide biosynthesis protein [Labrenzia sp. 011]
MPVQDESISGLLDAWEREVRNGGANAGSLLRVTGSRAAGPLLFLPAFAMVSPLGAIPGIHIGLSTVIVLVAVQVIIGSSEIWLPSFLRKRELPRDKMISAVERLRPHAKTVDRFLGRRLTFLTGNSMTRFVAGLCVLLAVLVYPATFIPVLPALPGGAIVLLSLGLLTRDGVVTLFGLVLSAVALGVLGYFVA